MLVHLARGLIEQGCKVDFVTRTRHAPYMDMLTPVVSTDCPSGPREILKDGRFGPLVPIRNPRMLAEAIATVLDTPPDADALKAAASRYHVRPATDAYLQVLGYDETPDPRAGSWDTPPRPMDGGAAGETR